MPLYHHIPHPHIAHRKKQGPIKVKDQLPLDHHNLYIRLNAHIALIITAFVGSMTCAWIFAGIAFAGLPQATGPGGIGLLYWISGSFLQLTLLSVIIVGQNIQAKASDKRAQQTYLDAESILSECLKLQEHLMKQDEILVKVLPGTPLGDTVDGDVTDTELPG